MLCILNFLCGFVFIDFWGCRGAARVCEPVLLFSYRLPVVATCFFVLIELPAVAMDMFCNFAVVVCTCEGFVGSGVECCM